MANIEQKIEQLVEKPIKKIGYELYDVEYTKEGKNYFLKIFIDSPKGINLDDCEKVSNEINEILDTSDYIKEQYFLEVSSPGIERVLRKDKHLEQNMGKKVEIKLFKKDERNNKQYIGTLTEYNQNTLTIDNSITIERKDIAQIKIVYNWD